MSVTWRHLASQNIKPTQVQNDEDDDWETDPDFVVSVTLIKRLLLLV